MAIVAVHRPQQQAERRREPEKDPLDTILKGLQIASSIYGIKTSMEQSRLNDLRAQAMEKALVQEKEQPLRIGAGELDSDTFFKTFYEVSEPEKFKRQYGDDIPIVDVKMNLHGEVKDVKAVDRDLFKQILQRKSSMAKPAATEKEAGKIVKDIRERTVPGLGLAATVQDAKELKSASVQKAKFDRQLKELIELRRKYGAEFFNREAVARGRQLSKDILLTYKNIARLGVLSRSDEDIINAIVPSDPLGVTVSSFLPENLQEYIGGDPILMKLEGFLSDVDADFKQNVEMRIERRFDKGKTLQPVPSNIEQAQQIRQGLIPGAAQEESNEEFLKRFIRK
jgi:hypothetical protein